MTKKFCKEKKSISNKTEDKTQSKSQVEKDLTDKLFNKANWIGVIFLEDLCDEYLRYKNSLDITRTMKDSDVKKLFATRLSVDLLQLYIDLSNFYQIPISFEDYDNYDCIEQEIEDLLVVCCNELEKYEDKKPTLKKILGLTIKYASLFDLSLQDLQKEIEKIKQN